MADALAAGAMPAGNRAVTARLESLHAEGGANWDISDEVLGLIGREVRPGMVTLETGAGQSTLAFLAAGARHTAVTPSSAEIAAIKAAARSRGLDAGALTLREGYSQDVLPRLGGDLDMALIDGGHGFPIPALDWAFIAPRIRPGGLLVIDDVDLWTGRMLLDFMKADPAFTLEGVLRGRTAAFRVTERFMLREWTNQPYVVARSRWPQRMRKARNLAGLLARFDLGAVRAKLANEKRLAEAAKTDY
jgi:predicted O-methyltransferase YrrM